MATVSIRLFGAYSVTLDGRLIHFSYDKMRALLAYLAIEAEHPHRRQSLAALFWPDEEKRAALSNLSQALYRIRHAIGDQNSDTPLLSITPQTIQLNPVANVWIDAVELAEAMNGCGSEEYTKPTNAPTHLARLQHAVDLYSGCFLQGIDIDNCPDLDQWLCIQREHYQRLACAALQLLADTFEQCGQRAVAKAYARRRLNLQPWCEEAHRQIMRLHLASGDRNAALAQYTECCRVLSADLDVEPSVATKALYTSICELDATQLSEAGAQSLPVPLTPLIGRDDELAMLKARLAAPGCRLVNVVGLGGSGKTRLAIEAASQSSASFAHGVVFVPLVSVDTVDAIAPAIAQRLNLALSGQEDAQQQVIDYLRQRQVLLLLDNFEQLVVGLSIVEGILNAAPQVKVLLTSRVKLNAPGEHVIALSGLHVADRLSEAHDDPQHTRSSNGAVSLFLYHVRRVHPDYIAHSAALDPIIHICRFVGGMPLSILLAAAWIDTLTPQAIVARLMKESDEADLTGLDLLEAESYAIPERQRSMRSVFAETWSLLTPPEQQCFSALAIFRGGFSADAAHRVAHATLRHLKGFVDKSMLEYCADGRYMIHEVLRQFALELHDGQDAESTAVCDRHAAYFAEMAHRSGLSLQGAGQLEAIRAMETDAENLRTAWTWAAQHGKIEVLDRAMEGLFSFYHWRGYFQAADMACLQARAVFEAAEATAPMIVYARLLIWHASFRHLLGQTADARALLNNALEILPKSAADTIQADNVRATALSEMSALLREVDRVEADRLSLQSLLLYKKVDNRSGMADALHRRGQLAISMGDYASAKNMLEESLTIYHQLEDRRRAAAVMWTLAVAHGLQGLLESGEQLGRQATIMYQELGDRFTAYHSMTELASLAAYAGHFSQAQQLLAEACAAFKDLGVRRSYALALHILGWIELNLGNAEEAETHYMAAADIFEAIGDRHGYALSGLGIGEILLARQKFDAASAMLAEAAATFQMLEQWDEYAITLSSLALAQRAQNNLCEAWQSAHEALATSRRISAFAPAHMALDAYALILADKGAIERSIEYHALVMANPYFGNSAFRKIVTDTVIEEKSLFLTPLIASKAAEQGRRRNIWSTIDEVLANSSIYSEANKARFT